MGSTGWSHFVPYQQDIAKALAAIKAEVVRTGEYLGSEHSAGGQFDYLAVCERNMAEGSMGTHSVLDITAISDVPEFLHASPVDETTLLELYGTSKPTHEQVDEKASDLNEAIERWEGRYVIVYRDYAPTEIFFSGNTGD